MPPERFTYISGGLDIIIGNTHPDVFPSTYQKVGQSMLWRTIFGSGFICTSADYGAGQQKSAYKAAVAVDNEPVGTAVAVDNEPVGTAVAVDNEPVGSAVAVDDTAVPVCSAVAVDNEPSGSTVAAIIEHVASACNAAD